MLLTPHLEGGAALGGCIAEHMRLIAAHGGKKAVSGQAASDECMPPALGKCYHHHSLTQYAFLPSSRARPSANRPRTGPWSPAQGEGALRVVRWRWRWRVPCTRSASPSPNLHAAAARGDLKVAARVARLKSAQVLLQRLDILGARAVGHLVGARARARARARPKARARARAGARARARARAKVLISVRHVPPVRQHMQVDLARAVRGSLDINNTPHEHERASSSDGLGTAAEGI